MDPEDHPLMAKIKDAAHIEAWSELNLYFLDKNVSGGLFFTDRILVRKRKIYYETMKRVEYGKKLRSSRKRLARYFEEARKLGLIRDYNMKAHYELYTGKKLRN